MADLGHRWDVAKEPQKIELALLGHRRPQPGSERQLHPPGLRRGGIIGGSLGGLAHLALDLLHELLDPVRGGHGFRPLDADDRPLGRLVREVQLEQARPHQHRAHEEEQDDDILAEQPAPGRLRWLVEGAWPAHLRNESARSRILRGTVIASRSAVLRFTARSILSLPSTGTSPGRAPRRILATSAAAWTP